jgi:hypothetical protein
VTWATPVTGRGITGGGSGYAVLLAHAEGVLYGMELGSVTLKRIGFFCFPIKHSTHTRVYISSSGDPKPQKKNLYFGRRLGVLAAFAPRAVINNNPCSLPGLLWNQTLLSLISFILPHMLPRLRPFSRPQTKGRQCSHYTGHTRVVSSSDGLYAVALWRGCHCTSVSAWGPFWPPMPRPRLLLPRPPGEGVVGFP